MEWNIARFGIPTCSSYGRIVTAKTLKYAAAADGYRAELLSEWALGVPLDASDMTRGSSTWMERGHDLEKEARKWYAWDQDVDVKQVGFLLRDDRRTGGSPDGLVNDDGILEVKCLGAAGHMKALMGGVPDEWAAQVQGLMLLSGRSWTDLCLFHPTLPKLVKRIEADTKFQTALHRSLARFLNELDEGKRKLLDMPGFRPPAGAVLPGPRPENMDALRNGVEPHPDVFSETETTEYVETMNEALRDGLIDSDKYKAAMQLHLNGSWTEARAAWNEVMDLVLPRFPA